MVDLRNWRVLWVILVLPSVSGVLQVGRQSRMDTEGWCVESIDDNDNVFLSSPCFDNTPRCGINPADGKLMGCVMASECPKKVPNTEVVCQTGKPYCCCQPERGEVETPCNYLYETKHHRIWDQACTLEELENLRVCQNGPPTTTKPSPSAKNMKPDCLKYCEENRAQDGEGDQGPFALFCGVVDPDNLNWNCPDACPDTCGKYCKDGRHLECPQLPEGRAQKNTSATPPSSENLPENTEAQDASLSIVIIVGIIVALLLLVCIYLCCCRKKKKVLPQTQQVPFYVPPPQQQQQPQQYQPTYASPQQQMQMSYQGLGQQGYNSSPYYSSGGGDLSASSSLVSAESSVLQVEEKKRAKKEKKEKHKSRKSKA